MLELLLPGLLELLPGLLELFPGELALDGVVCRPEDCVGEVAEVALPWRELASARRMLRVLASDDAELEL